MPHDGIVIKWEVASVVWFINHAPSLMCGRLQRLLLACRNGESYQAPGSSENDTECGNEGNRSEIPISFQVREHQPSNKVCDHNELNTRNSSITNCMINIISFIIWDYKQSDIFYTGSCGLSQLTLGARWGTP